MFVKNVSEKFREIVKKMNKPHIIKKLEKDHKQILYIFEKINLTLLTKNYENSLKYLNELFFNYKKHILYENNYLYPRLIKKYQDYENVLYFIEDIKNEEEKISNMIDKILLIYEAPWVIEKNTNEFKNDLNNLHNFIKERIDYEERRLFVLY